MEPRIALLDASHDDPTTPRNFRREITGELRRFSVVDREFPAIDGFEATGAEGLETTGAEDLETTGAEGFDAIVVTGSRASVYWDEPWIEATREWVTEALARGCPALGICWGHQLLADVLGGSVEPMGEYELGYRTVRHHGSELFDGVPEEFTVFTTHSDAVTELPDGASVIAENDYGVHGFQHGNVYGLQSHPEYDPATAESVVRGKDLPEERIESVCSEITDAQYEAAKPAKAVFGNFLGEIATKRFVAAD